MGSVNLGRADLENGLIDLGDAETKKGRIGNQGAGVASAPPVIGTIVKSIQSSTRHMPS